MTTNDRDDWYCDEDEIEGEFLPPPESLLESLAEARRLTEAFREMQGHLGEELKFPFSYYAVPPREINLRRPPCE
jgi:hypothetical protein